MDVAKLFTKVKPSEVREVLIQQIQERYNAQFEEDTKHLDEVKHLLHKTKAGIWDADLDLDCYNKYPKPEFSDIKIKGIPEKAFNCKYRVLRFWCREDNLRLEFRGRHEYKEGGVQVSASYSFSLPVEKVFKKSYLNRIDKFKSQISKLVPLYEEYEKKCKELHNSSTLLMKVLRETEEGKSILKQIKDLAKKCAST